MNVWALATIMRIKIEDVDEIYDMFEIDQNATLSTAKTVEYDEVGKPISYSVGEDALIKYLGKLQTSYEDCEVFLNLFRLIDKRGFGTIDIRDLLISVTVVTVQSVPQCIERAIQKIGKKLV